MFTFLLGFRLERLPSFSLEDAASPSGESTTTITRELSWHRRERRVRSTARGLLARFVARPSANKIQSARKAIQLLEKHHSQPFLVRAREAVRSCSMSWQGGQWKNYWKGAKGAQKKKKENGGKGGNKSKQATDPIPQYDAECWEVGSPSGPSRPSDAAGAGLQDLTKILQSVVQAGGIELPPEAKQILEATSLEESRSTFTTEQRQLNARRKAFNKVQKLKDALNKKHEKFKAFRQALKEQLNVETERYEKDVTELKEKIKQAELDLTKIEAGEVIAEPIAEILDGEDDFLNSMAHVKEKTKLQAALAESKANSLEMESKYMAAHKQLQEMQAQMTFLMSQIHPGGAHNAGMIATPPPSQDLSIRVDGSPQLPKPVMAVGPFTRMNNSRTKERSGPYGGEKTTAPSNVDNSLNGME